MYLFGSQPTLSNVLPLTTNSGWKESNTFCDSTKCHTMSPTSIYNHSYRRTLYVVKCTTYTNKWCNIGVK